jgi:hypothetical protein
MVALQMAGVGLRHLRSPSVDGRQGKIVMRTLIEVDNMRKIWEPILLSHDEINVTFAAMKERKHAKELPHKLERRV